MSLILQALRRAKELRGRKAPPSTGASALKSFGFGQAPKPGGWKHILKTYVLPATMLGLLLAYTANFWIQRFNRPPANDAASVNLNPPETTGGTPAAAPAEVPAQDPESEPEKEPTIVAGGSTDVTGVTPSSASSTVSRRQAAPPTPAPAAARARETAGAATSVETRDPPAPAPPPSSAGTAQGAPGGSAPMPAQSDVPGRDPFEIALFYQRTGDYAKAFDYYNRVLAKDPLNAPVLNNLGLLHLARSNSQEAIRAFRSAIVVDPGYAMAHNNLGIALMNSGQNSEAVRELERALELNPQNTEAVTNLGILARRAGNQEQAKFYYLRALQVNPSHPETHYNLAMIFEEQGEKGSAIEHFQAFLKFGSHQRPELSRPVEGRIEELKKTLP
jgi:Tfp pilus assembly protein PilF